LVGWLVGWLMLGIQFYYVELQSNQHRQHNGLFGVQ